MIECIFNNTDCENLILRIAKNGYHKGNYFLGCSKFPNCTFTIQSNFNEADITEKQKKLFNVFDCFVNLNSFLMATYGTLYFNLDDFGFLDYILKTDIVKPTKGEIEIGKSNAKIFYDLFYHLYLIPNENIRLYLRNNFPNHFSLMKSGKRDLLFSDIDYLNDFVNEERFKVYINAYKNY